MHRALLFLLIIFTQLTASGSSYKFNRRTISDGLSNSWVRCIYQDHEGFIWIGTSDGLNRFDGKNFTTYRPLNSQNLPIGNISINTIIHKDEKTLWLGTDVGLYQFDLQYETMQTDSLLSSNPIMCIQSQNDSIFWFGTNHGLYRFDRQQKKIKKSKYIDSKTGKNIIHQYVNTITIDSNENIWTGTKNGLFKIDSHNQLKTFFRSEENRSISGNDINRIIEDKTGNIWVGTSQNGLNLSISNDDSTSFKKVIDGPIQDLSIDIQNKMWIAFSAEKALGIFDIDEYYHTDNLSVETVANDPINQHSLSDNSVFCIYNDKHNDIWIGTFGNGFNYFSYRTKSFNNMSESKNREFSLQNSLVNTFLNEEEYLWIGTEGGLDKIHKATGKITHYNYNSNDINSLTSNSVLDIYKDSRENIWIGTWAGGLNKYNPVTDKFKRYTSTDKEGSISSNHVFQIMEDSFGNLWIATNAGGLNLFDYETETFTSYNKDQSDPSSLNGRSISYIYKTDDNKLLIALYNALDMYNYNTQTFTHIKRRNYNQHISGNISTIFQDSKRNIWLTTNAGLELYSPDLEYQTAYNTSDGLPDNTVQAILEDDNGNLWLSTNYGISKFVDGISASDTPVFQNFTLNDGLPANDFKQRAAMKDENGYMYFGSSNGYTCFHPDSIRINSNIPKIVFTAFHIQHSEPNAYNSYKPLKQNLNMTDKISLHYPDVDFTIGFAALNYLNSQDNKYQYKLEGYDTDWINAKQSMSASYTNLPEGKYTFKVLAANNDGIWSTTPKSIEIQIYPPWWNSRSFKLLIWVIAFFTGISFIYIRFLSINRENKELEARVEKRTSELSRLNLLLEEKQEKIEVQNLELAKHRDHLEELVEKRTEELAHALSRAEESDKLKSAFLANMSHEIRTPMNAIIGFSTMLAERRDLNDEKRTKYIDQIKLNGKNLNILINDIIDISIIEANQLKLSKSEFSISSVLTELFQLFEMENKGRFDFIYSNLHENREIMLYNDAFRFRQIMVNLLSNAFKYSDRGIIEYGFKVFHDTIQFYVKDQGIGISKEEIDRIFKHFYKAEKSKTKLYRGTGIGLSICKNLVDKMGGKIWVESHKGQGSSFFFTLPLIKRNKAK